MLDYEERQVVEANRNHIALAGTNVNIEGEMIDNENSVTLSGNWDALADCRLRATNLVPMLK